MSSTDSQRIIRFVYLSPSDKPFIPEYKTNLEKGVRSLQQWFVEVLDGYTFALNEPEIVEWYQTRRTSAWYHSDPSNGGALNWYWDTVLTDAFFLTRARFNQSNYRWMFYMDAFPGCNQSIGGTDGVALMGANDLHGLSGEPFVPPCPGEPVWQFTWGRWVGGMAHELGHTVGIDHPPDSPGGPDDRTLMYQGYVDFPNTYLRASDKQAFIQSGFFYQGIPIPGDSLPSGKPTVLQRLRQAWNTRRAK
jgi:hypothetical protein